MAKVVPPSFGCLSSPSGFPHFILLICLFLPHGIIHLFYLLNSMRNRELKQVELELAVILTYWFAWYCVQTSNHPLVSCSFFEAFSCVDVPDPLRYPKDGN